MVDGSLRLPPPLKLVAMNIDIAESGIKTQSINQITPKTIKLVFVDSLQKLIV